MEKHALTFLRWEIYRHGSHVVPVFRLNVIQTRLIKLQVSYPSLFIGPQFQIFYTQGNSRPLGMDSDVERDAHDSGTGAVAKELGRRGHR